MKYVFLLLTILFTDIALGVCPDGDVTGDCKVTLDDYAIMAAEWLQEGSTGPVYPTKDMVEADQPFHLSLTGYVQGPINGSSIARNRGNIAVIGYSHDITVPFDAATGMATGRRQHGPIVVYKYIDKSTPQLLQALCYGERMEEFELEFYRQAASGAQEKYYSIILGNAIIVKYSTESPNVESVYFIYETINWKWLPDNIESSDAIQTSNS